MREKQKLKKFWNWIRDESGQRVLRLEGPIDEDQLWGDEITPKDFRDELESEEGDVTLYLNSPGGNVFAASEIYTMLRDYPGKVTVKIEALAASAASVVAMAGNEVLMSPTALIMVHDPSTIAMGNTKDMEQAISVLNEVKESIINAYRDKTGLSHNRIAQFMTDETWFNAKKAVELGFADGILFEEDKKSGGEALEGDIGEEPEKDDPDEEKKVQKEADEGEKPGPERKETAGKDGPAAHLFSARRFDLAVLNRLKSAVPAAVPAVGDTVHDVPVDDTVTADMENAGNAEVPYDGGQNAEKPDTTEAEKPDAVKTGSTDTAGQKPAEPETPAETPPSDPRMVLTAEGKSADGSVPYIVLKRQLDLLK